MDSFRGSSIEHKRKLFVVVNRYDFHQIRQMLGELPNKALHLTASREAAADEFDALSGGPLRDAPRFTDLLLRMNLDP